MFMCIYRIWNSVDVDLGVSQIKGWPPSPSRHFGEKARPAYLPVSVLPSLSICRFERLHVIGSRVISPKYAFSAKAGARFGHLKSRVRSILINPRQFSLNFQVTFDELMLILQRSVLRIEQLTWHDNIETLNGIFYLGAINFFKSFVSKLPFIFAKPCIALYCIAQILCWYFLHRPLVCLVF